MKAVPKPRTMLGWRKCHGIYEPIREEIPVPEAPVDGYLVKILAAGICHSDYNLVNTDFSQPLIEKYTLGHEGCGEIIEMGAHISQQRSHLQIGDRVAIMPVPGCGLQSCYCCTTINRHELCRAAGNYGLGQDGFFAEYAAVSARAVVPLPKGVSPAVGAVATDALLTAYHAIVKRASLGKDDTVCIIGLGGLGLNGLQVARHIGARTIVTDKRQDVLDAAISLGVPADDVIPVDIPIVDFVTSRNLRIDAVIDFVGVAETCRAAQEIVRPAGKYILVGQMEPELPLMNTLCCIKRLEILFSFSGQIDDLEECLDMIQKGIIVPHVETDSMINFPQLLDDLHHGKIKSRMALVP